MRLFAHVFRGSAGGPRVYLLALAAIQAIKRSLVGACVATHESVHRNPQVSRGSHVFSSPSFRLEVLPMEIDLLRRVPALSLS